MLNNSATFSGKSMGSKEFLNQMVKALGITICKRPKAKPRKRKNYIIEEIG